MQSSSALTEQIIIILEFYLSGACKEFFTVEAGIIVFNLVINFTCLLI